MKGKSPPVVVANTCDPSIWETEAGGWEIQGQPELHGETLLQKTKNKQIKQIKTGVFKHNVEVLYSVSKSRWVAMCLTEMCMLDKLLLDMNYSTVGCESKVYTLSKVNKQTHNLDFCMNHLT
jgi:hypothetical protein